MAPDPPTVTAANATNSNSVKLTLSDLFKIINVEFNGKREDLNRFIRCCDYARSLADQSQYQPLLYYIITRITGNAASQIEGKEVDGWNGLKETLIKLFGPQKSHSQILEEINTIRQNSNESIGSFLNRIEHLQSMALDSIKLSGENAENLGKTEAVRWIALQRFIRHSREEISRCLRWKDPKSLSEAYEIALEEESALRERERFTKNSPNTTKFTPRNSFSNQNFRPQNSNYKKQNHAQQSTKTCNYCKKPGHLIHECRKREYNNKRLNINHNNSQNQHPTQISNQNRQSQGIHLNYPMSQVSATPVDNLQNQAH